MDGNEAGWDDDPIVLAVIGNLFWVPLGVSFSCCYGSWIEAGIRSGRMTGS